MICHITLLIKLCNIHLLWNNFKFGMFCSWFCFKQKNEFLKKISFYWAFFFLCFFYFLLLQLCNLSKYLSLNLVFFILNCSVLLLSVCLYIYFIFFFFFCNFLILMVHHLQLVQPITLIYFNTTGCKLYNKIIKWNM